MAAPDPRMGEEILAMHSTVDAFVKETLDGLDTPDDIVLTHDVSFALVAARHAFVPMVVFGLRGESAETGVHFGAIEICPVDMLDPDEIFAITLDLWWRVRSELLLRDAGFYTMAAKILDPPS